MGQKRKKEPTDKWKEQMVRHAANSKEVPEHNNVVARTEYQSNFNSFIKFSTCSQHAMLKYNLEIILVCDEWGRTPHDIVNSQLNT
jgi:hypothetical protein